MIAISLFRQKGDKPFISKSSLARVKTAILGSRYDMSFAFVNRRDMRRLNRIYRGKNTPTDILAFPLRAASGELILCSSEIKRRASLFGRTPTQHLRVLLIHGLLHLKGMRHGSRMERQERKFRKKFKV